MSVRCVPHPVSTYIHSYCIRMYRQHGNLCAEARLTACGSRQLDENSDKVTSRYCWLALQKLIQLSSCPAGCTMYAHSHMALWPCLPQTGYCPSRMDGNFCDCCLDHEYYPLYSSCSLLTGNWKQLTSGWFLLVYRCSQKSTSVSLLVFLKRSRAADVL